MFDGFQSELMLSPKAVLAAHEVKQDNFVYELLSNKQKLFELTLCPVIQFLDYDSSLVARKGTNVEKQEMKE